MPSEGRPWAADQRLRTADAVLSKSHKCTQTDRAASCISFVLLTLVLHTPPHSRATYGSGPCLVHTVCCAVSWVFLARNALTKRYYSPSSRMKMDCELQETIAGIQYVIQCAYLVPAKKKKKKCQGEHRLSNTCLRHTPRTRIRPSGRGKLSAQPVRLPQSERNHGFVQMMIMTRCKLKKRSS